MDTTTVIGIIEEAANKSTSEMRDFTRIQVGQVVRQGDIYLHRVPEDHPRGEPTGRQLAQGSSSGARHIAEEPARCFTGLKPPRYCAPLVPLGPVIVSASPFVVSHPDHASVRLAAGVYQVTYQLDARTLQRVQD